MWIILIIKFNLNLVNRKPSLSDKIFNFETQIFIFYPLEFVEINRTVRVDTFYEKSVYYNNQEQKDVVVYAAPFYHSKIAVYYLNYHYDRQGTIYEQIEDITIDGFIGFSVLPFYQEQLI